MNNYFVEIFYMLFDEIAIEMNITYDRTNSLFINT